MAGGQVLFVLFGLLAFTEVFCGKESLDTGTFCVEQKAYHNCSFMYYI
jgi:hypothetical protein